MNERALHLDETTLERWTPYSPLGFLTVPLNDVAATFVRSIEGPQTGQVYELGD